MENLINTAAQKAQISIQNIEKLTTEINNKNIKSSKINFNVLYKAECRVEKYKNICLKQMGEIQDKLAYYKLDRAEKGLIEAIRSSDKANKIAAGFLQFQAVKKSSFVDAYMQEFRSLAGKI